MLLNIMTWSPLVVALEAPRVEATVEADLGADVDVGRQAKGRVAARGKELGQRLGRVADAHQSNRVGGTRVGARLKSNL